METIETQTDHPASCTNQSRGLWETISGIYEKMNAIINLLEDDDSLQNSEVQATRKEEIKKTIEEVCKSHQFLAEEFQRLQSAVKDLKMSEPLTPLKSSSLINMEALGSLNDSQLNIGSNPESTVDNGDIIECEGIMNDVEYVKRFSENSATTDGNNTTPKKAWSDGMKCKFSKLVEENTQLQVELIRRNSEKRETIIKLQNQVKRLRIENDNLQGTLRYFNHNKQTFKMILQGKHYLTGFSEDVLHNLMSSKSFVMHCW